ncbi:GTPase Era [Geosporobacter ferrireducens]|uniref:GTPase Era n=1 Tax=Geosporobacter ferrireducens TaxID=1424294 RepID=A0A1D8GC82_9FIRM|nr:GTPase Era [Geosporobacter ferrireducens]AOT68515.1 GTPase Era [Geosporobacter ferrireducens]MTI53977.1 GTPase Era [Geosporobacter ferrireducens]
MKFKSGFVTIVGRPNVGKSTLMNRMVGEKIAIMSDKPQTTRNKIQSIYTQDNFQIIFLDTPGIHKPKNKLGEYMVKSAQQTLNEVDVVLFLIDDTANMGGGDQFILESLKEIKTPIILVINKIDKIPPDAYEKMFHLYNETGIFKEIIGISALEDINIQKLLNKILSFLPEGPQYFPGDMITDQPERVIVSEIIREKLLHYLQDEVPHGVAVQIDSMKKREDKDIIDIQATILCERKSHKGIIIGKNGRKLKGIGKSAREDIERLMGTKIFLELWVKIKEDWRDHEGTLNQLGYK